MGQILNNRTLTPKKFFALPSPIILCVERPDFVKAINESGSETVTLNLPLAKTLVGSAIQNISANVTTTVVNLLPAGQAVYLTDYEVLFDPRYKLDVIKLFCEIARHKKLFVKWCGGFLNDSLTYAEPGFDDYAKYKVSDYEIACII